MYKFHSKVSATWDFYLKSLVLQSKLSVECQNVTVMLFKRLNSSEVSTSKVKSYSTSPEGFQNYKCFRDQWQENGAFDSRLQSETLMIKRETTMWHFKKGQNQQGTAAFLM